MKLQTRLALIILSIFLICWLIAGFAAYALEQRNARQETALSAEMMLNGAIAARQYNAEEVEPLLSPETVPPLNMSQTKQFLPQSAPSYAAQQVFSRFSSAMTGYTYAERVLNPTNPKDLAEGWQVELIQTFINTPNLTKLDGHRQMLDGQEVFYVAQPIKVESPRCLKCHGRPEDAPAALINTYGTENGFGWTVGETVGTRVVSVPTSIPQRRAWTVFLSYTLLIASVFLMGYTIVNLIVRRWLLNPLESIAHEVEQISLSQVESSNWHLLEEAPGELSKLSQSINRLLISLKKALLK